MKPVVLSDVLAVGEFPSPEQVAILAKAGFKSILNNQPDGEVERFAPDAELAVRAARNGLAHAYVPLSSRMPPDEELQAFARAVAKLPPPIYAFCYSGARSAAACALCLARTETVEAIIRRFSDVGVDLTAIRPFLEEAGSRNMSSAASALKLPGSSTQGIVVFPRVRGASGFCL